MDLADMTSMLESTPQVAERLLAAVSPEWLHRNDGPGTWSAYDIVGHLLHGDATNWMPRLRMILAHGTGQAFEPFDREAMLTQQPVPISVLLADFRRARQASLAELATLRLRSSDLDRTGRHPALGEVTLGQLLAAWVAHDLTHLGQIGEVLACRLRHAVGPWRAYLPALDRTVAAE